MRGPWWGMRWVVGTVIWLLSMPVWASGGPLGIDHRLPYDGHGIWRPGLQKGLKYGMAASVVGGALLLGDETRIGDTFWRSTDALAVSVVSATVLKQVFRRERPVTTRDPDHFFHGGGAHSFPSGTVTAVSAMVTPFMVRYGSEYPAVYALSVLPVFSAIQRVKVRQHWQSDVLAGMALGAGVGYWASQRRQSLIVGWLPGGFRIGFVHRF